MGKRFVPVRDADRRAIELYLMLREVEQMPLVDLRVYDDSKEPIFIGDRNDPKKWWTFTVDQFLRLNVTQAKAEGATALALRLSQKKPARPRLPQTEVDRAVNQFCLARKTSDWRSSKGTTASQGPTHSSSLLATSRSSPVDRCRALPACSTARRVVHNAQVLYDLSRCRCLPQPQDPTTPTRVGLDIQSCSSGQRPCQTRQFSRPRLSWKWRSTSFNRQLPANATSTG